ncbi:MAG: tetraacyldisaccharide 4'-kinase, partial [Acidobacteria bacterium]
TPLVKFLAESLLKRGRRPAILTRGYGRRNGLRTIALAPKSGRIADSREAGDEPALLARALPEVPIVVSADRYEAGRLAEDRFGADVHLLDDGFQHLALARDVDVVVLDITQEFSDRALLPAGGQREPCSALKRAHIVVLTRVELGDPSLLEQRVRQINPQARVFHSRTKFCSLVDAQSGRIYPSGAFEFANLKSWGFSLVAEDSFRDHHVYSERDVARLLRRSKKSGAEVLVTTEKDAMNIPALFKDHRPILACVVQTELDEGQAFEEEVLARLKMAEARI